MLALIEADALVKRWENISHRLRKALATAQLP